MINCLMTMKHDQLLDDNETTVMSNKSCKSWNDPKGPCPHHPGYCDCTLFQGWQVIQQGLLTFDPSCPKMNRIKTGQQRTHKPSCCDGTIDSVTAVSRRSRPWPKMVRYQKNWQRSSRQNAPGAFLAHSLERHGKQKGQATSPSKSQCPP